ncbi:MAG: endopeptidase La [bacterium]|nr:endopeptidase La [bacterium]
MDRLNKENVVLPLIPLRELVSFPSAIIPILVGRERSINALKYSRQYYNNFIFLSVQKNQISENPHSHEIAEIGIIARLERTAEQENGSYRVIVHGLERARINRFLKKDNYFLVSVTALKEVIDKDKNFFELSRDLITIFEEYISLNKVKLHGIVAKLESNRISEITDVISSVINIPLQLKQALLEELNVYTRAVKVFNILKKEMVKLRSHRDPTAPRRPREDSPDNEVEEYKRKIEEADFPEYVRKRAKEELERFEMMPPFSAESTVSRSYLDWLLAIPWRLVKDENYNIKRASRILDEDHYGLEKAKDRILDYLAVRQLVKKSAGEILCFVGPPGVGKSSLSKSIARALNREFVRVSLGGVKDEAEIRGHRRTYVGSYPGQIIKGLKKAKYKNPVFLLDEIDKLNSDFRGDPASALLEVLDPEQNSEFVDHYLDLEIDLSQIFFITTANSTDPIPPALKDRMEIIEIPGYTEREKLNISKNFLSPKQAVKNGLSSDDFEINDELILDIINQYTREAGVRTLERQLGVVIRKIARHFVETEEIERDSPGTGENAEAMDIPDNKYMEPPEISDPVVLIPDEDENYPDRELTEIENGMADSRERQEIFRETFVLTPPLMEKFLGIPKFNKRKVLEKNEVGVCIGLAWTMAGGDILIIESRCLKGKGNMILTGSLGDVMKESSSTAFSYSKIKLSQLDFDTEEVEKYNIHLHIPEGAVPKEGPSAGVTLAVSILSLLTGIPVKSDYAMTGEITLRGKILPVGGIKEKIIAAHRYGITNVLIPVENEKDFKEDIPDDIKETMTVHLVDTMDELLDIVLEKPIKIKNINSKVIRPFMNSNIQ